MASKDQYELYRSLYEEEERTSLQLEGRSKVFLGIISAFLVTILLKTKDAQESAKALHIGWAFILGEGCFERRCCVCCLLFGYGYSRR